MKNFSVYRIALVCSALSTIFASFDLAADPRPPSCLTADGTAPEPGSTCCDATPVEFSDENGPLGNGTVIGNLLTSPNTFHSIGLVWDIDGDADHDGLVSVRYRKLGACSFAPAMPLIRNDYAWFYNGDQAAEPTNNFAGSLMFLTPGTTYEVVLELSDPDGGRAIRVRELTTRAIPRKPTAGRTLYVVPGSGGGSGTSGDPFQGISAANAAAQPGDIFLLRSGTYSGATLNTDGTEGNYIVYQEDPADPGAVIESGFLISADHLWIDELTFVWDDPTGGGTPIEDQSYPATSAIYATGGNGGDDIVITDNNFSDYFNGVYVPVSGSTRWTVMDNTMVGPHQDDIASESNPGTTNGKAVVLGGDNAPGVPGSIIAYNDITRYADCIGLVENSDAYGNACYDMWGSILNPDGTYENVRAWGNLLNYTAAESLTFQPQRIGPWYFLYNHMHDVGGNFGSNGVYKWRTQDRMVIVGNTMVASTDNATFLLRTVHKNNLWLSGSSTVWRGHDTRPQGGIQLGLKNLPQWLPYWGTDVDYNGFDWGGSGTFIRWYDDGDGPEEIEDYDSIAEFVSAIGICQNCIEVDRDAILVDASPAEDEPLELAAGTNAAVDAGIAIPNIADFYLGSAPDLGAHERGTTMHFGPRAGDDPIDKTEHWTKH